MQRLLMAAAIALALVACAFAQQKAYDYKNLTADDIAEIKARRHEFYTAKSQGKQEAIRLAQLQKAIYLDGNEADYNVKYYGIDVYLNFSNGSIVGKVDYVIEAMVEGLNAIDLNLATDLTVDSVRFGATAAGYSHAVDLLSITTPAPIARNAQFSMTVYYHGTPRFVGEQGMEFASVYGNTMCWTNCEPFGSRNWWPCKDHPEDKPDSVDIYVDYPSTYKVMSAGAIVSDVSSGTGRKRIHFNHNYPVATYLVAITCANFTTSTQTWNYGPYSMPVYSYTVPNIPQAKQSFETWMIPVLNALSNRFGTYPFATEKAGNAHYGWGGAMEHQTCSFYNPTFYDDWVIAHETGHQWFGDMITCKTFNHVWLNEGFASYSEPIFFEQQYGFNTYKSWLQSQKYLGGGTIYVENTLTDDIFDNNLVYDKGSWVVHMLRGVLGDSVFFNVAMPAWYNSPFKYGAATTSDFTNVISTAVGHDMSWFVDQWIYGDGSPNYQIAYRCEPEPGGYRLAYLIRQTQSGGTYFKMPIRTRFVTTGGNVDTTIWNEGPVELYTLHFADSVTNVIFDADEWILRQVTTVPLQMTILTVDLPDGEINSPYAQSLEAVAGTPPYSWTFLGGDLPFGLNFTGGTVGEISGTPTYAATFYFSIMCQDASIPPASDTSSFAITIIPQQGLPGDADGSGGVSISDAVYLINYIFAGGPAPNPMAAGDADCSGAVSISDAVFLINYIFASGPAPSCP
ncbi:MAG: hypothetical protein IT585_01405 [candidate division Zixibacteria bacterium]|nr:hypothetical protein [candidate division Zixibacteria bacterium]